MYVVAEMSANHGGDIEKALEIIAAARKAGADAVKLQTYTPDTLTIDCQKDPFRIKGTLWDGKTLYDLYGEARTPWEWQPRLFEEAGKIGLDCFSTPFDATSVDFLEKLDPPAYKVASFENGDIPLLRKIARTGKPVIMSTGMATEEELGEAVEAIRGEGNDRILLLLCTSAYPAPPEEIHLKTMADMRERFGVPVGLSDHTQGIAVPVAAVALGACLVEKHFKLRAGDGGPDGAFSLDFDEFRAMVENVRLAEKALGEVNYALTEKEKSSTVFRRSLFVVEDVKAGEVFTGKNVRSIRPGHGLAPKHYDEVLGRKAAVDIERGTPLSWDLLG